VRYRFRGVIRETGKLVEGHVTAPNEDEAFNALSENGIVTEGLQPDPVREAEMAANAPFGEAIESALDSSAAQIPFDDLVEKYKGKRVWVIDREKIRGRVSQVVDAALAQAVQSGETTQQTRERVMIAIREMFADNRNIATETPASQVAMEQQISRMGTLIKQAESVMAMISAAIRRGGFSAGGRRRDFETRAAEEGPNQEVLLEIFKSNIELLRTIEGGSEEPQTTDDAPAAGGPPADDRPPASVPAA
jgi:hypothetical protein